MRMGSGGVQDCCQAEMGLAAVICDPKVPMVTCEGGNNYVAEAGSFRKTAAGRKRNGNNPNVPSRGLVN